MHRIIRFALTALKNADVVHRSAVKWRRFMLLEERQWSSYCPVPGGLPNSSHVMSSTFLSNVETGKADPSLSTLKPLAYALGVSVSELVKEPPARSRRT